jgi:hypothetical protein
MNTIDDEYNKAYDLWQEESKRLISKPCSTEGVDCEVDEREWDEHMSRQPKPTEAMRANFRSLILMGVESKKTTGAACVIAEFASAATGKPVKWKFDFHKTVDGKLGLGVYTGGWGDWIPFQTHWSADPYFSNYNFRVATKEDFE